MSEDISEAREILRELKLFWCLDDSEIVVTRLGGVNNMVFRVDHGGEQYALRIPGNKVNRAHEAIAARAAAKLGIAPDVVHFDPATGVMVTRLVDDAVTMTPQSFKTIVGAPSRAALLLRQLHQSDVKLEPRPELLAKLAPHLKGAALVPCHCDPRCEDFLSTGLRMWIVDWEYAGLCDPMWDIALLSVHGAFSDEQDAKMMQAYFDGERYLAERERVSIYKAMVR